MRRVTIGTVPCHFLSRDEFLRQCQTWLQGASSHHIVTLNPEMVVRAETDAAFRHALQMADYCIVDGAGVLWAHEYVTTAKKRGMWRWWLTGRRSSPPRLTGVDSLIDLCRLATHSHQKVYLLGGTPSQLTGARKNLQQQFPTLAIVGSPPHVFSQTGPAEILADIRRHAPDILAVAYGAPKQSVWIHHQLPTLPSVKIAIGVGGALAMVAGEYPRAPHLLRHYNLEWLWRLLLEPSRLPRIWRAVVTFPRLVRAQKRQGK